MRVKSCSYSSDKKLANCEMQFYYRYTEGLKKRVKDKGLYMGDWMHQLYEYYYRLIKEKKKREDWKKKFRELKKTLWDKLFEEEREQYEEDGFTPTIAEEIMTHYNEVYGSQDSRWEILMIEEEIALETKFGFPIRAKIDLLIRDPKGHVALVETKNKKEIDDLAKERLYNGQVHGYAWLLLKMKKIKVDYIIWNYIRTTPVPRPQILKDGSLSKRKINTDRRSYLAAMKEAKIHPKGDEVIGVENFLKTLPETLTLKRENNRVDYRIGELRVRDWVERHRRALQIEKPTRNFQKSCSWMCEYYDLCMADQLGTPDRNTIIKKDFVQNIKAAEEEPANP